MVFIVVLMLFLFLVLTFTSKAFLEDHFPQLTKILGLWVPHHQTDAFLGDALLKGLLPGGFEAQPR